MISDFVIQLPMLAVAAASIGYASLHRATPIDGEHITAADLAAALPAFAAICAGCGDRLRSSSRARIGISNPLELDPVRRCPWG